MSSQLASKEFWKDTADRTIRTMAQTAIAACGTATVIKEVDWKGVAGTTLLAGILCVLTCIATSGSDDTISPASTVKYAMHGTEDHKPRHAKTGPVDNGPVPTETADSGRPSGEIPQNGPMTKTGE